jgi:uncharacterized membrane protein YqaE (UPF0057 family)
VLLSALFPPLGVWLTTGLSATLVLNLVLTLLFWFPGTIHGLWVVAHTRADGRPARDGTRTFLALILATFLPPLGVWWKKGLFSLGFWLNLLLTAMFWLPGMVHALWVVTAEEG